MAVGNSVTSTAMTIPLLIKWTFASHPLAYTSGLEVGD